MICSRSGVRAASTVFVQTPVKVIVNSLVPVITQLQFKVTPAGCVTAVLHYENRGVSTCCDKSSHSITQSRHRYTSTPHSNHLFFILILHTVLLHVTDLALANTVAVVTGKLIGQTSWCVGGYWWSTVFEYNIVYWNVSMV